MKSVRLPILQQLRRLKTFQIQSQSLLIRLSILKCFQTFLRQGSFFHIHFANHFVLVELGVINALLEVVILLIKVFIFLFVLRFVEICAAAVFEVVLKAASKDVLLVH